MHPPESMVALGDALIVRCAWFADAGPRGCLLAADVASGARGRLRLFAPTPSHGVALAASPPGDLLLGVVNAQGFDPSLRRLTADGELVWDLPLASDGFAGISDLAVGPDGTIYIAGNTGTIENSSGVLRAVDGAGELTWDVQFTPSTGRELWTRRAAMGPGFLVVIGVEATTSPGIDDTGWIRKIGPA